ncbi:MAG: hypothetical protein ACJ768_17300 [Gaiellaceae bacterium]
MSARTRRRVKSSSRPRQLAALDRGLEASTPPDADSLAYIARVRAAKAAAKSTRTAP